jgi:hypothetical protein
MKATRKRIVRGFQIPEQAPPLARGPQRVETLRGVLVGEALGTFQFDDQHIFHENIGKVRSHALALVSCGE